MAQTTLTDVSQALSYLLGEQSVPTTNVADREFFIQRALERIYRIYDFDMAKLRATVTQVAGVASLPSGVRRDAQLDVRYVQAGTNDDIILEEVPYEDHDKYSAGDRKYYRMQEGDTTVLYTNETGYNPLTVRYTPAAPVINASISTPFPSSMTIALGALVYYRQAEDPEADVAQIDNQFIQGVNEAINAQKRAHATVRAKGYAETKGHYTGYIG